ncbi:MAG: HD domain-containing protein [Actinobacteria bacterium]|nr:HD domain-containing protein [Actinomycetota bacterium]
MDDILKNKIIRKMMEVFEYNNIHINHTYRVLDYAQDISVIEKGNPDIVVPSAILHDIGIPACEKKYKSTEGQLQEIEGPPLAKNILESLNLKEETIKEVCGIVGSHHSPGEIETINFKIMWDADWLVNLPDVYDIKDKKKLAEIINKTFMTETGIKKAKEFFL